MDSIVKQLVHLSKEAAKEATDRKVYVAGDITMTGRQMRPMGDMELETLIDIYKEEITALAEAGVDLLVVETMMSLAETRAALIAAKEVCDLPVMVTMTFERDGRTLYGSDAATCAIVLESLGAAAIGVNCSTGPKDMCPILRSMAEVTASPDCQAQCRYASIRPPGQYHICHVGSGICSRNGAFGTGRGHYFRRLLWYDT